MGVKICDFKHCRNNSKHFKLFSVPKVSARSINIQHKGLLARRRKAWLKALNLNDCPLLLKQHLRICSSHFSSGNPANLLDLNNIDWSPSINLYSHSDEIQISGENVEDVLHNTSGSSVPGNESDINEPIMLEAIKMFTITRSLGIQTETDELIEKMPDDDNISSSDILLDENSGTTRQSIGVQSVEVSLNEVQCLRKKIKELNLQLESCKKESENLRTQIECQSKKLMNQKIDILKLSNELSETKILNEKLLLNEVAFLKDDKKVKFFTGLPNLGVFKLILRELESGLSKIKGTKLSNFQKLILTFMKLRFNLSFFGLQYRFLIDRIEASKIFYSTVAMISHSFDQFIYWPNRNCMKLNVPVCFEQIYGDRVSVIIDCFEIGTERPSALKGRNEMFSQYKQKYTVKYLIGMTPHGVVSFISPGYTGRSSDNSITECCGILDKLSPGDIILADRGFTISELVCDRQAELKTPAFKHGSQLHPLEIEDTRKLASVRVHIERIIGQIRLKYKILNGPIPISLLKMHFENRSIIDHIVKTACIMINLCDSIVSQT